jgi:hypothetical protein
MEKLLEKMSTMNIKSTPDQDFKSLKNTLMDDFIEKNNINPQIKNNLNNFINECCLNYILTNTPPQVITNTQVIPNTPNNEEYGIYGKLKNIGEQILSIQKETNVWINTPLEAINDLKPDFAGKVGEEIIKLICKECGITNENTGDKNSKDGTYDQKIGDILKKVEIKTARIGGGKYQHETLKKDGCDYWLFVDIKPDGGCITILPKFDLTKKHPITGTTPTPRKGTTDVFKWDFTETHLSKFVLAGVAIQFDKTTPTSEIGDFIKSRVI